jgi:hypothetical protein
MDKKNSMFLISWNNISMFKKGDSSTNRLFHKGDMSVNRLFHKGSSHHHPHHHEQPPHQPEPSNPLEKRSGR